MWLATINLMRPWGIVYKMKKKTFTLVLKLEVPEGLRTEYIFFGTEFFFSQLFHLK